jgi:hypothetical protein
MSLTTIKINTDAVHTRVFANSAQSPRILKKQQIIYIVKNVIVTVLTKIALITTTMFVKRFINAEIVIRLY